jgi:hypothetical protein
MSDHINLSEAWLGHLGIIARAIERASSMTGSLSPHMAEKVVFTELKATIATYKFGTVNLGRREMRLKILSSKEDLVGRADAAMVRLGAICMFVLDVVSAKDVVSEAHCQCGHYGLT